MSTAAGIAGPSATAKPRVLNPWIVAIAVIIPTFMEVLDTTIANVALRYIAGGLSAPSSDSEWVITSYLAANAIILPMSGWLSVRLGRRRYFLLSIAVFTLASVLCGIATNLEILIAARVLQGLAGGGLQPSSQGVLLDVFPPEKQGSAMTLFGIAARWRKRHARGRVIIVRYADDIVIGFEHEGEARRFLADMRQRMEKFALSLHPDKTRLIEFGRYAAGHRARRGLGKPETFNFLGFTHICSRSSRGVFQLKRLTRRDRMRARLRAIKEELQRRMHEPIPLQGKWLGQVVRGYFAYHAVPTNCKALSAFRHYVMDLWRRALQRRSQRDRSTWERIAHLAREFLPQARILHPWPSERFAVKYPRWEPGA